jgi:hypothetical protein
MKKIKNKESKPEITTTAIDAAAWPRPMLFVHIGGDSMGVPISNKTQK